MRGISLSDPGMGFLNHNRATGNGLDLVVKRRKEEDDVNLLCLDCTVLPDCKRGHPSCLITQRQQAKSTVIFYKRINGGGTYSGAYNGAQITISQPGARGKWIGVIEKGDKHKSTEVVRTLRQAKDLVKALIVKEFFA